MKHTLLHCAIAAAAVSPTLSFAQAAAPAAAPAVTGNMTIASDYRFRGISQTFREPALQGGFDYAHSSGFYIGNWNSNVSGISYPNGAGLEMDLYAGYKKSIGDVTLDVGTLYYYYPAARYVSGGASGKFDNWEVYGGASWKWISAKLSYSLSNYFGLDSGMATNFFARRDGGAALTARGDSKGTIYFDVSANYEIVPKLTLNAHVGVTKVANYGELDYMDYKLGATYDLSGWQIGLAAVGTDADQQWYYARDAGQKTRQTGKPFPVLTIGKTF